MYALKSYGLDISNHKTASLQDVDVGAFQFVVALDKNVKRELIEEYAVPESKMIDLFVDDPFGDDLVQYRRCAERINRGLNSLKISN